MAKTDEKMEDYYIRLSRASLPDEYIRIMQEIDKQERKARLFWKLKMAAKVLYYFSFFAGCAYLTKLMFGQTGLYVLIALVVICVLAACISTDI